MAKATFSGSWGHHLTMEVNSGVVSQSIENNTSRIRVWVDLRMDGVGNFYDNGTRPLTIHINKGGAIEQVRPIVTAGHSQRIFVKEYTIYHDSNGNGKVDIKFNLAINTGNYGEATVAYTMGLPTIPRASNFTMPNDMTLGGSYQITINPQIQGAVHTVKYDFGGSTGTIAESTDSNPSFTPALSLAEKFPNTTRVSGRVIVETLKDGKLYGSKEQNVSIAIPESVKPTVDTVKLSDLNTKVNDIFKSQQFVELLSNIQIAITGKGVSGSSITGYRAEILDKNLLVTNANGSFGIMRFNGDITIRCTVLDSRGRWSEPKYTKVTVIPYAPPAFYFSVERTGALNDTLTIIRNASVSRLEVDGEMRNEMTISFRVAEVNTTDFKNDTGPASGKWGTIDKLINSPANLAGKYPSNTSYVVIGTMTDKFLSVAFRATIGTKKTTFAYDSSNRFSVGKFPDKSLLDGSIEATGDIYARGKQIQQYALTTPSGGKLTGENITNVNELWDVGYYYINGNAVGLPVKKWGQMFIVSPDGNTEPRQPMQIFITDSDGVTYTRIHNRSKVIDDWKPWTAGTVLGNHPSVYHTDWLSAGYAGTYYKRDGDIVAIRYDFQGNGSSMEIGTIPTAIFNPVQSYMQPIANWSMDGRANTHIQINKNSGTITVLDTKKIGYAGQLLIMI